LAFERSSAVRIAVLRVTNQSQRELIAAALGAPVRIGGIAGFAAGAAATAVLRTVDPSNNKTWN